MAATDRLTTGLDSRMIRPATTIEPVSEFARMARIRAAARARPGCPARTMHVSPARQNASLMSAAESATTTRGSDRQQKTMAQFNGAQSDRSPDNHRRESPCKLAGQMGVHTGEHHGSRPVASDRVPTYRRSFNYSSSRRRHSSRMSFVRLAPTRVTPKARTSSSASRSRIPPAAFTCTSSGVCSSINFKSGIVAPPVP